MIVGSQYGRVHIYLVSEARAKYRSEQPRAQPLRPHWSTLQDLQIALPSDSVRVRRL
jgi:hypothetical protein